MTINDGMKEETPVELIAMEKASTVHHEQRARFGLSVEEENFLSAVDEKEVSQIFWKVDLRLVPMLALLYLASHLDRANIGG